MAELKTNWVCVLGGGNGAHAVAADLVLRGLEVNMCELPELKGGTFKKTLETGKIKASGLVEGIANLNLATTDFGEAISGAKTIFMVTPSFADETFAGHCAPYLEDGHIVVLFAGNCGTILFKKVLREKGIERDIILAETSTLPYGARLLGLGHIGVYARALQNYVGVLPARHTDETVNTLRTYYSTFLPLSSVVEAALRNDNPSALPALFNHKKRRYSHPRIGAGIPPENSKKAGSSPAFLRWLFSEFKRSISDYQATATGSFALLRFRFGFSALVIALASSTSACSLDEIGSGTSPLIPFTR